MTVAASLEHWLHKDGLFRERGRRGARRLPLHGLTTKALGDMKEPGPRSEALARAGLEGIAPRLLKQVHGTAVIEASMNETSVPEADGWISTDPRLALCVYVADCLPIFMWDSRGSAVGIFHAGWRGLAAGMAKTAAKAFGRYGLDPMGLCAAIGPHVGVCCYSVGPDVGSRFDTRMLKIKSDVVFLDLGEAARLQLLEAGLAPESISVSGDCTACCSRDFFSYRREKGGGSMMAFISARRAQ